MTSVFHTRNTGNILVLSAAILWGTTGTAQAFAPSGFNPLVIGSLRLLVAGLLLLLVSLFRGNLSSIRHCKKIPLFLAAVLAAGYQLCFFSAVARTGVAIGTVVGIGSAPILGGLLGRIFCHESLHGRWFVATLLAISGCGLLSFSAGHHVHVDIIGIFLALGAGACYAGMTVLLKEALQYSEAMSVMAVVFFLAALMLIPVLLYSDLHWLLQPRSLMVILHLGLVATAIPYILFARGLQKTTVTIATILTLAEPMTAASLGILILHESMNLQVIGGIALIFTGLGFLIVMEQLQKKRITL